MRARDWHERKQVGDRRLNMKYRLLFACAPRQLVENLRPSNCCQHSAPPIPPHVVLCPSISYSCFSCCCCCCSSLSLSVCVSPWTFITQTQLDYQAEHPNVIFSLSFSPVGWHSLWPSAFFSIILVFVSPSCLQ